MISNADTRMVRLLQLASPTLPVGAYSYSQGLESSVEAGVARNADTAQKWIGDVLEYSLGRTEAPLLSRLIDAWARKRTPRSIAGMRSCWPAVKLLNYVAKLYRWDIH